MCVGGGGGGGGGVVRSYTMEGLEAAGLLHRVVYAPLVWVVAEDGYVYTRPMCSAGCGTKTPPPTYHVTLNRRAGQDEIRTDPLRDMRSASQYTHQSIRGDVPRRLLERGRDT